MIEGYLFYSVILSLKISAGLGSWFSLATGNLETVLPSTPGHIGTFDYFAILGLVSYGVEWQKAAASILIIHSILWFPVTIIGLLLIAFPGMNSERIGFSLTEAQK